MTYIGGTLFERYAREIIPPASEPLRVSEGFIGRVLVPGLLIQAAKLIVNAPIFICGQSRLVL